LAARHDPRWTSPRCLARCVAIGLKGASEALLLLSGGKPGNAATSSSTDGQIRYIDGPESRVSEAPQEGNRRLSWALRHSAFSIHMLLTQLSSSGRICFTVSAGAGLPYMFRHAQETSRRVSNETFLACRFSFFTWGFVALSVSTERALHVRTCLSCCSRADLSIPSAGHGFYSIHVSEK
jgi:hypothetical protein